MKKYFLTGLALLLPLALTVAVVLFIVNFLTTPFMGAAEGLLSSLGYPKQGFFFLTPTQTLRYGSQILILIMLFGFTVFLGFITRWFFVHSIIRWSDNVLHSIPLVNKFYKTFQDVINTIFQSQSKAFKQVVLVPYPNKDTYSLGLVTREAPSECMESASKDMVSVLLPTTPNPTSGYLLMYPRSEIIMLDMRVEDAMKYVFSMGLVHPEKSHDD